MVAKIPNPESKKIPEEKRKEFISLFMAHQRAVFAGDQKESSMIEKMIEELLSR